MGKRCKLNLWLFSFDSYNADYCRTQLVCFIFSAVPLNKIRGFNITNLKCMQDLEGIGR